MRHGDQSVCGLVFNLADTTQGLERKERDDLSRGLAAGRLLRRLNRRDPVKQMKRDAIFTENAHGPSVSLTRPH